MLQFDEKCDIIMLDFISLIYDREAAAAVTIKIISNPYTKEIKIQSFKEQTKQWEDIKIGAENSRLREYESDRLFLPFRIKEIIDTILADYGINSEKIHILFEGTQDEYIEVENVCMENDIRSRIELSRSQRRLENARIIFEPTKEIFANVRPIIEKIIKDDKKVCRDLNKVSDALRDIIPICVFGNYSAGKSTFINALIGAEVLPSGGDPVTAKVYKIERSKQPDNARVRFSYKDEAFDILFEGTEYRLLCGNSENELVRDVFDTIKESGADNMFVCVRIALELINGYEKKDKSEIVISNVIELEIPFSKSGILGQSYNNFVIFDTPGSNSESNMEHSKVLAEALEGFSNGIPVWVSTYETLDSTDNASLCEKILDIDALDKRFTMIVLNKADGSDLGDCEFSEKKEQEILEYSSVEKMYSSGIYFVSSIMGLGAKNGGALSDKHYRKIFRSQQDMYNDPDDEDYAALYKFNIMPYQIKKNVEEYSSECKNLIYANSGLYCIEQEMENFASKHSAYNKCQMVYKFLAEVIAETDRRISSRTETIKRNREIRRRELESKKAELIDSLGNTTQEAEYNFERNSAVFVRSFVASNLSYKYEAEALDKKTDALHRENEEERNFSVQEKGVEDSKNKILKNAKNNVKDIFKGDGNFLDRVGKMTADLSRDGSALFASMKDKFNAEKEIDKDTSDELIGIVVEEYRGNIIKAQETLGIGIREHWQQNARSLRNELIRIITGSDALTSTQRDELSDIIMSYQDITFNDNADDVFIKERFLRGSIFGVQLYDDEKLNTRRLAGRYNTAISKAISEMSAEMNMGCFNSFRAWEKSLLTVIEGNITEYNPQLRDMSEMIKEETEKIAELEEDQATIQKSLNAIEDLMNWKVLD